MITDGFFIDRKKELEWLHSKWSEQGSHIILLYGRRRVGKTRLVLEWARMHGVKLFYFVADEQPEHLLLERLSRELAEFTGDEILEENPFTSWRQFLLYIERYTADKSIAVVIDEFQYAVKTSPSLPSVLQVMWDTRLRRKNVFLILTGSLVSFTSGLLSGHSPLYGRLAGHLMLAPLKPVYAGCFATKWPSSDRVRLYGVLGGIPGYLELVSRDENLWDNVYRLLLSPGARLLDEPYILLREELREVYRYFAILEAIARGATRFAEIASKSRIPSQSLSKYLGILRSMGLIREEAPVIGGGRRRYMMSDPFLRFWFRYIPRYKSAIDIGLGRKVITYIKDDFESSLAPLAWEETVGSMVEILARRGDLPITPTRIGRYWWHNLEIDLLGIDETREPPGVLLVEAKWSKLSCRDIRRELDKLRAKSMGLPIKTGETLHILAVKKPDCRNPSLLPDEMLLTLEDYDRLTLEECRARGGVKQFY